MAENAGLLKDNDDIFATPAVGETSFDANPIYRKIFEEKERAKRREGNGGNSIEDSSIAGPDFDPVPIIRDNTKQLKTLQFDLSILVSGGIQHRILHRFTGHYTDLELVEGAFQHFKVEIKRKQPPLKLYIQYLPDKNTQRKGGEMGKKERDLTVYYSFHSPKPSSTNYDGMVQN